MDTPEIAFQVRDRLEIVDAIYRFGAGIDFADEELLTSAFSPDAVLDVTSNKQMWGLDFPLFEGRDVIINVFKESAFLLDTTHAISNPRTKIDGNTAKLYVIAEAQHLLPDAHSQYWLVKSHYDVSLVRDGDRWVISHLIINTVWFTGDPQILVNQPVAA